MEMPIHEMRVVLERLERLERLESQNRRLRQAVVLAMAVLAVILLSGQTKNRTVEAEKFILTDDEGRSRAELWADKTTTQLAFYDQEGRRGLSLSTDAQGNESTLTLFNKYGMRMLVSAFLDSGAVSLAEKKEASDWQYLFELAEHGRPSLNSTLSLWNAKSRAHVSLEADSSGPGLGLTTMEGSATLVGSASVNRSDTGEKGPPSAASLVMLGKNGKVIWHAP